MRDNQTIWLTSCFMQNNQICKIIGWANFHEVLQHITTTIYSDWFWNDNFYLFLKLCQSLTWISWCGYQEFWISIFRLLIFIVNCSSPSHCLIICKFNFSDCLLSFFMIFIWNSLIIIKGILYSESAVLFLFFFCFLRFWIEILLSLSDVSAYHF